MFKHIFGLGMIATTLVSSIARGQSFSLMTESDHGDYIGGGKSRNLSTTNKDKLTIQNSDTKNLQFTVESFNFGTPMSFSFGAEDGKSFTKGLYDQAKRYPFRGSYNGIDISGDGRGCNTILGKFYVHEYSLKNNGSLNTAAIDFVQYCEGGTSALYGSFRYNSSITSGCNANSCTAVKRTVGISTTSTPTRPDTTTPSTTTSRPAPTTATTPSSSSLNHLRRAYRKSYTSFSSFMRGEYRYTYARNFRNVRKYCDINNLFDKDPDSLYYLNPDACGADMKEYIVGYNDTFAELVGENDDSDSIPTLQEWRNFRNEFKKSVSDIQKERRANRIPELDVIYSLGQLMLINIDYQAYKEIVGL